MTVSASPMDLKWFNKKLLRNIRSNFSFMPFKNPRPKGAHHNYSLCIINCSLKELSFVNKVDKIEQE